MKQFMDENFLLQSETAQKLYHSYAADAPILDYHCHINPQEIYEDRQFENITQVWLGGDHYKWRFMRSCGVDEKYITDHYEMRILLESEAAARAAKNGMPDADPLIEKLMDIQKRMESLSTSEYENLNFDVHSSIWTAADNMRLYKMLANLWNGPSIGFTSPKLEHYIKSTQEHIDILTAIRNHDAKKARKEMEQHTERSMNNILKSFKFR